MSSQRIPSYMLPAAPSNPTLHNRKSGWMDKLVDYVVGDGAANRYALICRYCATHNGLATPEEYPYTGNVKRKSNANKSEIAGYLW